MCWKPTEITFEKNLQTDLLISTAHKKLCVWPKWKMKADLESFENQFYKNIKSPNLFYYLDTLIWTTSDEYKDQSTDWVHNSVSHQILKTNLNQQLLLKFFDIEMIKTMLCEFYNYQKLNHNNSRWTLKWSLENTGFRLV